MPELPEVESIVRALCPQIIGKAIRKVDIFDPRFLENTTPQVLQSILTGQNIRKVQRRGKFILFNLSNNYKVTTHLRMTGKYLCFSQQVVPDKRTRLVVSFADESQLHYHDLRRFGKLSLYPGDTKIDAFEKLGPEPLGPEFTPQYLLGGIGQRKVAIKQLLLDQSIIAGIGNIYASEILFDSNISPFRQASQLADSEFDRIVQSTRDILAKAIECLGTTFSDYRTPDEGKGSFQECLRVYGRAGQPCFGCGAIIKRVSQAQRSTFFCPNCQT